MMENNYMIKALSSDKTIYPLAMSSRKSFKILCIPQFFYQHLQITDPFWVSFFFKFKTETILPLIVKIPTKISALPKKNQSQTTDVRFIKTFLSFNSKTPVLVKTCRCPYSNVHSVACWIKKKYSSVTKQSDKRKTKATYCCPNNLLNLLQSYVCTDM